MVHAQVLVAFTSNVPKVGGQKMTMNDHYYADPRSLGSRLRRRRFQHVRGLIKTIFDQKGGCRVLDLGGTVAYWTPFAPDLSDYNVEITVVNLDCDECHSSNIRVLTGDARSLDFADASFDLIHSNSVIEHVGSWRDMRDMAREVRRLAPYYFVQVPYFWFFVEPHFRLPFFHWLPEPVRAHILTCTGAGFFPKAESMDQAMSFVQHAQLLNHAQMEALFPDARIAHERICGVTKSLMAIRDPGRPSYQLQV